MTFNQSSTNHLSIPWVQDHKTLRTSNQVTIFTLLSWEASHLEHLHRGLELSPRNAQAPSELGRIGPSEVSHYEYLRRAADIAHIYVNLAMLVG